MAGKKILIIDDDQGIVRLNESILTANGYSVISAFDGEDGLVKAQDEQPDLILLDIILPKVHGFEVCKRLKADDVTKNIPIIMVTGFGLEEVAENEEAVKADDYIAKPYSASDLVDIVQKILS